MHTDNNPYRVPDASKSADIMLQVPAMGTATEAGHGPARLAPGSAVRIRITKILKCRCVPQLPGASPHLRCCLIRSIPPYDAH